MIARSYAVKENFAYVRQFVEWLVWMRTQEEALADKPNLEYFVVSPQFDGLWFVDRHDHWSREGHLEMPKRSRPPLNNMFGEWYNAKGFALPPCHRPAVNMAVPDL